MIQTKAKFPPESSPFTPTPEQQAVVSAIRGGSESLMVNAYAGCAKTSTLVLAAAEVRQAALALAFNKKIALDMADKLPGSFTVKTMNGLGHGAWLRANPTVTNVKLEEKKLGKLVSQVARDRKVELSSDDWEGLRQLVTGAMQAGIVPTSAGDSGLAPDNLASWKAVADNLMLFSDQFEFLYDMAHETLERDIALAKQGTISFDDQVYCSALLGGRFPQYPVVFVDESQDLSPLNHRMLELSLREDGRLVSVGDRKQAIYAFRGADGASMDSIRGLRHSWKDLLLGTTFRCPKAVVARQQDHAPGFKAWGSNREGRVERLGGDMDGGDKAVKWTWNDAIALSDITPHQSAIAILCRNNGPLLSLAFRLIRRGIGVNMLGRDLGKGLLALSRKLAPEDSTPVDVLAGKLLEWEEREIALARANEKEEKIAGIVDRAECIRAVLGVEVRDAGELRFALTNLFERNSGIVTLGSIHRSKGLEWDTVIHLDPWRVPSKWAKLAAEAGDPVPLEQEWNLKYVCETRTKHTLLLANLSDFA